MEPLSESRAVRLLRAKAAELEADVKDVLAPIVAPHRVIVTGPDITFEILEPDEIVTTVDELDTNRRP